MKKLLPSLLLALLAACAPTARLYPPDTPLVFGVPYRTLFDRTLQELTAAYVPDALERRPFSVTEADPETGLITAVRNGRGPTATVRYRYPGEVDVDDEDIYRGSGFPFGFGLAFAVPVPTSLPEQTLLTVVVRPEGEGASLIYSAQDPDGTTSEDGVRLMRGVVARLEARFRPAPQPAPPEG